MKHNIAKCSAGKFVQASPAQILSGLYAIGFMSLTNCALNLIIKSRSNSTTALINQLSTPRPMCRQASGGVIHFLGAKEAS